MKIPRIRKPQRLPADGPYRPAAYLVLGLAVFLALAATAGLLELSDDGEDPIDIAVVPELPGLDLAPPDDLFNLTIQPDNQITRDDTVKPGQTLAGILGPYLSPEDIESLDRETKNFSFSRIAAGNAYRLVTEDDALVRFEYEDSPTRTLVIRAERGEYLASLEAVETESRVEVLTGVVKSSLFDTVRAAGGDAEVAVSLADIFSCDIDFCKDVHKGDTFTVVLRRRYAGDTPLGAGSILAAEFVNQGKTHQGFAYGAETGKNGYFDAQGAPLRKAFLRAPLSFLRISSGYTHSRLHPILKVRKPHHGIDYAAPAGTPIWTVADGVIAERGANQAAGNFLTVRHGSGITTRYNHLSRFGAGMTTGRKVRQGQVIGYVGSTGYATGPHLDFRMYQDGRPLNFLKQDKLVLAGLDKARLADFKRTMGPLADMLRHKSPVRSLAGAEPRAPERPESRAPAPRLN